VRKAKEINMVFGRLAALLLLYPQSIGMTIDADIFRGAETLAR
jgi:hypothetical protein